MARTRARARRGEGVRTRAQGMTQVWDGPCAAGGVLARQAVARARGASIRAQWVARGLGGSVGSDGAVG
eukprot:5655771-Lingulodinium_polyedra.AAC.1